MNSTLLRQSSFAGGEIAPLTYGLTESPAYQHGLKLALNFLPTIEGPLLNRSGTRYVCAVKDASYAPRLVPFAFSDGQTFRVELGDKYLRLVQNGAQIHVATAPAWNIGTLYQQGAFVTYSGIIYYSYNASPNIGHEPDISTGWWVAQTIFEVPTPWAIADVPRLNFAQSGDVITVVHPAYQPQEIQRITNTNWTVAAVSYAGTAYFGPAPQIAVRVTIPLLSATYPLLAAISPQLWSATETYSNGDFVLYDASGTYTLYRSTSDGNLNNQPDLGSPWSGAGNYVSSFTYQKGDYIWVNDSAGATYGGQMYISITDNNVGNSPSPSSAYWQPASDTSRVPVTRQYVVTTTWRDALGRTFESLASVPTQQIQVTLTTDRPATIMLGGTAQGTAPGNYVSIGDNIYGDHNNTGIFGYIGSIAPSAGQFTDNGDTPPDYGHQPPRGTNPFDYATGANTKTESWPGSFTYHEQRAVYARSDKKPQDFWGSAIGNYYNFDINTPVQDSDAYEFRPASERLEEVRALLSLRYMLLFTGSGVWGAYGPSGAITPSSIMLRRYMNTGASYLQPLAIERTALFQTSRGRVHDLNWDWRSDMYVGRDVSLVARHFFDGGLSIVDWCYAETPFSVVWAVLNDGRLLSLTYSAEGGGAAWAQHVTPGSTIAFSGSAGTQPTTANFERVCSAAESDPETGAIEDAVYVVVKRVNKTGTVRYIERFSSRVLPLFTPTDVTRTQLLAAGIPTGPSAPDVRRANFLDSSLKFDGRNSSVVTMTVNETTWTGGDTVTITANNISSLSPLGTSGFNSMAVGDSLFLDPDNERVEFTLVAITDATHAVFIAEQGVSGVSTDPDYDPHASALAAGTAFWGWGPAAITNLAHLEGCPVNVLVDGAVAGPFTVASGEITLPNPGCIVQVGLGYNSDMQLLDVAADTVKTNQKSVRRLTIEAVSSRGILVAQNFGSSMKMYAPQGQQVSDGNTVPPLITGNFEVSVASSWDQTGSACVRQSDPLPLSIVAVVRELVVGGR